MLRKLRCSVSVLSSLPKNSKRWMSEKGKGNDKEKEIVCCESKKENPVVFDCNYENQERGICCEDPCDSLACYPEPRVVIVGAGMAGLAAAARLSERGISNLVVLEANERPGGRIHSCWLGDVVAELGAHWRPDNTQVNPIYQMTALDTPPRPGVPGSGNPHGLFNRVSHGNMPYPTTVTAYCKYKQIEEEAARIFSHGGYKQHGSMLNFMSLRIQQELHSFPESQQHDAARVMYGLSHLTISRSGDDTALLSADNSGCFMNMPGGEVRIPLGLVGVLAPLLRQVPIGSIRYCKPVTCIYWGTSQRCGYRAKVYTADGEEFPADYVIVTPSIGVLRQNAAKMFCPELPASKLEAIKCLGFGYANKIYLEYCRPYWVWHYGNLNFSFAQGLPKRIDWTRGVTAIEVVPNSKHVLCVWVVGPDAHAMEGLSDKDVAENMTCLLRDLTCNMHIPYPQTVLRSQWTSDPYFCGAYSYSCSSDGAVQRNVACPLPGPTEPSPPILLFAGEATVPGHFATVAGARLSGIREAERIVQLTITFKGPPIPQEDCCEQQIQKETEEKAKEDKPKKSEYCP